MSETATTATQADDRKLLLDDVHRRLGASMSGREGWIVPLDYGDAAGEYAAVREAGAGLIDLSTRGRINVAGAEAVQFLNGLVTNDMKTLADGAWMKAALPNVQGRLLALMRVLNRGGEFLFDTEAATSAQLLNSLARFTLAGDFRVTDVTGEILTLSVQGARASEIIRAVLGEEASQIERGSIARAEWDGQTASVIRATHTAEDGFDIFVEASVAASLWDALAAAGAAPVGYDALEMLRIEAGEPRYGVDVNESNVMLEAGQDDAVSFTKGCYVGQEIIARIHWRGHVAKRIAGLVLDNASEILPEDKVRSGDGKEIGRVTSTAFSQQLGKQVALGIIKYDYLAPGTPVIILRSDEEHAAQVAALPLVRGSWFDEVATEEESGG